MKTEGKDKSDRDEGKARSEDAQARRIAQEAVVRGMVAEGLFDPTGLNEEEARTKLRKQLRRQYQQLLRKNDAPIVLITTDRTPTLTKEARRCEDQDLHEIAILLYATACEHWLNDVISALCKRRNLNREDAAQVIRDASVRAKCTWLLKLLRAPAIKDDHFKKLMRLMDLRNEFAHFKWKGTNYDVEEEGDQAKKFLATWKQTLDYLSRYRQRVVYRGVRLRKRRKRRPTTADSSLRSAS
jgi:hypothetical protein